MSTRGGRRITRCVRWRKRRRFPGDQVARPGAEQWEMAEELHMMQRPPLLCHDSEESCTNSFTSTPQTISYCSAWPQPSQRSLREKLRPYRHWKTLLCWFCGFSLCCPGPTGWERGRNLFTWPFHLRDWQSGSCGAQLLSLGPPGDPWCPPNAPDAYPFHTISLRVTNSCRSANGNG